LATNDSNTDGPSIVISTISGPTNGSITLNPDGSFTYTPDSDFFGTDTVIYSYCDLGTPDLCDTAILIITVNPINDAPVAVDDQEVTNEDTSVVVDVTENDTDIDGNIDPTSVTVLSGPDNGTVSIDPLTGEVTYTPDPGFNGTDSFTYQVCDDGTPLPAECAEATVIITVGPCSVLDPAKDCDGDGVTNGNENQDGTDPNNACDFNLASATLTQSPDWSDTDCDGDGVSNANEVTDGTDPKDACDFLSTSISLEVTVICEVELTIPQGFSPNGDDVNDLFVIRGIEQYPENTITILNRWGNIVFEDKGYLNNWDGSVQQGLRLGGDELPIGTYFYILDLGKEAPGIERINKGFVYLTR